MLLALESAKPFIHNFQDKVLEVEMTSEQYNEEQRAVLQKLLGTQMLLLMYFDGAFFKRYGALEFDNMVTGTIVYKPAASGYTVDTVHLLTTKALVCFVEGRITGRTRAKISIK